MLQPDIMASNGMLTYGSGYAAAAAEAGTNFDSELPEPDVQVKIMFAGQDIVADFEQGVKRFLETEHYFPNTSNDVNQQFEAALRSIADLMDKIATHPPKSSWDKITVFRAMKVQSTLMEKISNLLCGKH